MLALVVLLAIISTALGDGQGPCLGVPPNTAMHLTCFETGGDPRVEYGWIKMFGYCLSGWLGSPGVKEAGCKWLDGVGGVGARYGGDMGVVLPFNSPKCRAMFLEWVKHGVNTWGCPSEVGGEGRGLCAVNRDYTCYEFPCAKAGYAQLGCYGHSITPAVAKMAKEECFSKWQGRPKGCTVDVTWVKKNVFGCATVIEYSFSSEECRKHYLEQEPKNNGCHLLIKAGLDNPKNQLAPGAASSYDHRLSARCKSAGHLHPPPPCNTASPAYHLSCYKYGLKPEVVIKAKQECFKAWSKPECQPMIQTSSQFLNGCETAVSYSFASIECRAEYQEFEAKSDACHLYRAHGLHKSSKKMKANTPADYQCPYKAS